MSDIETLTKRIRDYADQNQIAHSTISRKLFGNGKRLQEIELGGSLRLDTYQKVDEKLTALEAAA